MKLLSRQNLLAWSAGFFDGEGCITIRKHPREEWYQLLIGVTQKTSLPLVRLQGIFPSGCLSQTKTGWSFIISGGSAAATLKALLPFLTVKAKQAQLGIEFQDSVDETNRRKLTPQEKKFRQRCHKKMKSLKRI